LIENAPQLYPELVNPGEGKEEMKGEPAKQTGKKKKVSHFLYKSGE
jgi:hypothetical protein